MGRMLLFLVVLLLVLSKPFAASAAVGEDAASAAAVRALNRDESVELPADFGYRPAVTRYALKADGGCSSPIALPAAFEEPCKAHDLGYDVLRYAAAKGHPLGPWAREVLDATFARRVHEACQPIVGVHRITCEVAAEAAGVAVRLNSWRQHSGPPVKESGAEILWSLARR